MKMKRARNTKVVSKVEDNAEQHANGGPNPLLLAPVLRNLFEIMPFNCDEFKNFRLVSDEWAKASLPFWRKEVMLEIEDDNGRLQEFLKMLRVPNDPYKLLNEKICIKSYNIAFTQNLCFRPRGSQEFWTKIGPLMEHLIIHDSRVSSVGDFARILFEMTPNLISLEISGINRRAYSGMPYPFLVEMEANDFFIGDWDERVRPSSDASVKKNLIKLEIDLFSIEFPISWTYFFARLPNIKELTIKALPEPSSWNFRHDNNQIQEVEAAELFILLHSMRAVKQNMGPQYFSQLETLDFTHESNHDLERFPSTLLPILRDLNFPLTSLSFDIGSFTNVDDFRQILELYSPTLEVLYVHRGSHGAPFPQDFPFGVNIPNLQTLRFAGPISKNLNFLANTPNLITLVIDKACCHSSSSECTRNCDTDVIAKTEFANEPLRNLVLPKMKQFIIEHEIIGGNRVKALSRILPNLETLCIGLRTDGFTMVCQCWKKLYDLHIHPNLVTEMGFLGMRGRNMYRKPNITSLKDLTQLTLCPSRQNSTKGRLTNDLVRHGLLVCQNLKTVQLTGTNQLNKEMEDMLESKQIQVINLPDE